ncbi:MAG: hypothetical protein ACFFCO_05430 [Promethearchaeota archaeon]
MSGDEETPEEIEAEEQAEEEEKDSVAHEIAESLPKFFLNVLVTVGLALFYFFVTPIFLVLDMYPLLQMDFLLPSVPVVISGYNLLQLGVLLVIILFGVEAIIQFSKFASALVDFFVSRLPGMKSRERATVRRIPLDVIYICFVVVIFILIQPALSPATFPITALQPYFQILAVCIVLYFVLTLMFDLAKSIQKSAKRGIDKWSKRFADRVKE